MTTTRAPRSDSLRITGSEARIRPSSVITPLPDLSNGTFRSDLTSTRRPADVEIVDVLHVLLSGSLSRSGAQPSREATRAVRSTRRLE